LNIYGTRLVAEIRRGCWAKYEAHHAVPAMSTTTEGSGSGKARVARVCIVYSISEDSEKKSRTNSVSSRRARASKD